MEAFAHIVEIAFAKEVPPDYSINCSLHLSYLKTTVTRTSYDSTTKYGLCQNSMVIPHKICHFIYHGNIV